MTERRKDILDQEKEAVQSFDRFVSLFSDEIILQNQMENAIPHLLSRTTTSEIIPENLAALAHGKLSMFESEVDRLPVVPGNFSDREHYALMYQIIKAINGEVRAGEKRGIPITQGQLMHLANFGPRGYYRLNLGIGRKGKDLQERSAFTTPLEFDEQYREALGDISIKGLQKLHEQEGFTQDKPACIFIVGDGEGKLCDTVSQRLLSSNYLPKEVIEITVIDASELLLEKQKKILQQNGFSNTKFLKGNAKYIGAALNTYRLARGILIAGEELADVFAPHVLTTVNNQVMESGFLLDDKGWSYTSSKSEYGILSILRAFPHYYDFLKQNRPAVLNTDLLQMMVQIAESSFEGYWIGGDYCLSFTTNLADLNNYPIGLRAMTSLTGFEKLHIETALTHVADVTADVDPTLFSYWEALGRLYPETGMRMELLAPMGRIIEKTRNISKNELLKETWNIIQLLQRPNIRRVDTVSIENEIDRLSDYYYDRFNWIAAKGKNTPSLF